MDYIISCFIQNWGKFLLGGFLCLVIIDTIVVCLGANNKITEDDVKFAKWLREPVLEKTIITTNSDGFESAQKIYRERQGDGRPWGISGIC